MTEPALHLDGNAIGGLLGQLFATEMTAARRDCPSCGQRHATGAHRLYVSAGVVLRCPGCGDVALRCAELPDRVVLELRGTWTVDGAA
jgi:predicted RNA-binding Zn-ribbon protein involved in translation (DUF1610 family)